ncbi:hypothetical protein BN77_1108 [Rhizobium mesoamericanum STM3625]|uniref:Uncharacterized protein n=1 Tax=Rhizobium mesoamericanum STM3625 TaxID=1211777 RepID=K0PBQ0_9HYPH|nr:hypothetical protein BN77_1108 [Rhizobium mesoamericanum STM3625]
MIVFDRVEGLIAGLSPAASDLDKGLIPSPGLCPHFRAAIARPPGYGGFVFLLYLLNDSLR